MLKLIHSLLDLKLIFQSAPSLIASLFGMFFTSYSFKLAIKHKKLSKFPFIFQSSSILGFKGNIELGYIMHLSTKRKTLPSSKDFKRIAISNSCSLIFQSITVGFLVGCLSVLNVLLRSAVTTRTVIELISASLVTCCASTLALVISFIFTLELSVLLSIDSENFLMPVLNALNDIMVVRILYIFAINVSNQSSSVLISAILATSAFGCFCFIISYNSNDSIPRLSMETVVISFILNITSGFILDRFSPPYPMIAPAYPVFAGMGSSIAFIFLHKKFTSLECNEIVSMNLNITLVIISVVISSFYILVSQLFKIEYSHRFAISFIVMFTVQVLILLKLIDKMILLLMKYRKNISANTVPLTSSVSDFLGTVMLLGVAYLGSLL